MTSIGQLPLDEQLAAFKTALTRNEDLIEAWGAAPTWSTRP
jgi:hypothetical protein